MVEHAHDPLEKWSRGFAYRKWLYVAAIVIGALVVALLAMSAAVTVSTSLCAQTCHVVNPQYQSWKRSNHAQVPCYRCHVGSSPIAWLRHTVIVQPANTLNWLRLDEAVPLNQESEAATSIPDDRCVGCHDKTANSTAVAGRPRERHAEHVKAGLPCVQCHNRVAHKNAERYKPLTMEAPAFEYTDYLTMRSGCWRCHSTSAAYRDDHLLDEIGLAEFPPTDCGSCHVKSVPTPDSGLLDHSLAGWSGARHGRVAAKNYGECFACHPRHTSGDAPPDCTGCHNGIAMPHNIGDGERFYSSQAGFPRWAREHANFEESAKRCAQCHQDERADDLCTQCHHEQYLEGRAASTATVWPQGHRDVSAEVGESCQECHMVEFCAYCHSKNEKPPKELYFYRLKDR